MPEFQRARSESAKLLREADILEAARRLGARDGVRAVTLTGIADEVGMHKSGLLRYFETREQIFLRLAATEWQAWGDSLRRLLADATDPHDVGAALASSLVDRPFFCDLLAHVPLSLERNVSVASVLAFKRVTLEQVDLIGVTMREVLPALSKQDTVDVVSTAVSTAGAMWQMSTPGEILSGVYREDPSLAHAIVDLEPTLTRILTAVVVGLLA